MGYSEEDLYESSFDLRRDYRRTCCGGFGSRPWKAYVPVCHGLPGTLLMWHRQTFVFALLGAERPTALTACGGGYFMPKSWILELRQE